jgi:hypothetical protein
VWHCTTYCPLVGYGVASIALDITTFYTSIMRGRPISTHKIWVENAKPFDIAKCKVRDENGRVQSRLTLEVTIPGGETTFSSIRLVTSAPHFGGLRYWFECPSCQCRVGKLYALDSLACRKCHNLVYLRQYRKGPRFALLHASLTGKWNTDAVRFQQSWQS